MEAREEPLIRPVMPELNTLRGIAILAVVFYHGFEWSAGVDGFGGLTRLFVHATGAGWLGVNLFFVLSGFLITGILLDSKDRADYYRRFYIRRALRILPAYYALLLLLAVTGSASAGFLGLSAIYLANVTPLFGIPRDYGVLWSLAVEEHFYLIWPAAVRSFSRRNLAVCAAGIAVLMPVFRGVAFLLGLADGLSSYTWLVADGLAMGALLALLFRAPGVTRKTIGRCAALGLGLAAALLALGAPFGILTRRRLLGAALQVTPWNLAFAALLGSTLVVGTSLWKRWVRRPLLSFFGDISYGLYLVHMLAFWQYDKLLRNYWPALASIQSFGLLTIRFVVAGGAAVAIAFLSRWWFEERFLRLKNARIPVAQNRSLTVAAR